MKKSTPIPIPRRVVLPLAAAALMAACDQRPPATDKPTSLTPRVDPLAFGTRSAAERVAALDRPRSTARAKAQERRSHR